MCDIYSILRVHQICVSVVSAAMCYVPKTGTQGICIPVCSIYYGGVNIHITGVGHTGAPTLTAARWHQCRCGSEGRSVPCRALSCP